MNTKIFSAKELLRGSGISVLDAARFVRNILDARAGGARGSAGNVQFVLKVIECGLRGVRNTEMGFEKGFRGHWVQDVLRHTYASYHAKRYGNLARLQLCMGHGSLLLLRSRYVNMRGISLASAAGFFN